MLNYDNMDLVNDVSYQRWITLRDAADIILKSTPTPDVCKVTYTDVQATARNRTEPDWGGALHQKWKASIEIEAGIQRLIEEYSAEQIETADNEAKQKFEL
mmetsp:Transcript_50799/g.99579  ORF Transcript_50799/g.99579 Transcript_50799/m.99579 type:complete len:101 (-) Transcript_50799:119-421(-)